MSEDSPEWSLYRTVDASATLLKRFYTRHRYRECWICKNLWLCRRGRQLRAEWLAEEDRASDMFQDVFPYSARNLARKKCDGEATVPASESRDQG